MERGRRRQHREVRGERFAVFILMWYLKSLQIFTQFKAAISSMYCADTHRRACACGQFTFLPMVSHCPTDRQVVVKTHGVQQPQINSQMPHLNSWVNQLKTFCLCDLGEPTLSFVHPGADVISAGSRGSVFFPSSRP